MQKIVKDKRKCYKTWYKCKKEENWEKYKNAKKDSKKVVRDAKTRAYDDLYNRLGTKEGEKTIYRITKIRDKKTKDITLIKYIKSTDARVLVQDEEIKERWRSYFDKLFNED